MSEARRWPRRWARQWLGSALRVALALVGVGVPLCATVLPDFVRAAAPLGASTVPRDTRLELALEEWRKAQTAATLEAALRALAELGAPDARLRTIGVGRAGRTMFALELGAEDAPGIVLVPGTLVEEPPPADTLGAAPGPNGALDTLLELARALVVERTPESGAQAGDAQADGAGTMRAQLRAQLEAQRVVLLFGARTDLLAPRLESPGFELTRNFPVDWDLAQQADGGPYPLALPETRALARWLDAEPNLFAAVLIGASPIAPEWLALGAEAADREQTRLSAGPRVSAAVQGVSAEPLPVPGGFARHARLRLGLAVVALPARPTEGTSDAARALGVVAELLDAAPRLELVLDPAPRAVGPDLWQVDAVLANVGGLGTANVAHTRERRPRGVELMVAGGDLVVGAVQVGDGPFRVLDTELDRAGRVVLRLADLDAGARLAVRLFIRPAEQRSHERGRERPFELRAEAPRALATRSFVTPARER